jgi:hypothetical protein
MPRITDLPATFASVGPLTADELWQVHDGAARISLEAGADEDRGIRLTQWQTITIIAGKTVRYRRDGGSAAVISREIIG